MLTPDQLKSRFLRDMPLIDDKGRPATDELLQSKISAAEAAFQRKWAIRLTPAYVRMGHLPLPSDTDALYADLPRVVTDARAYEPESFEEDRHVSLRLPLGPLQTVIGVGLKLPGAASPRLWPTDWVQVLNDSRTIQIYPQGATVSAMPFVTAAWGAAALGSGRTIPNAWQVAYVAGYTAEQLAGDHADVLSALGMVAAIGVLVPGSIDRYISEGITGLSASVDGLSNSTQLANAGGQLKYAGLIAAYTDQLKGWEATFQARGRLVVGSL